MNSERQNEIKRAAQKLNIPEIMLKGIVIPEGENIETFLLQYAATIETARSEHKRPGTVPNHVEGNEAEKQFANSLLEKWGLGEDAKPGDETI